MATRVYFDTQTPTVSPTADGSWEVTGSMVRRWLETAKYNEVAHPEHGLEALAVATALNSPAGAVDALILQAVSAPLASNVTISGAIKGQIIAVESNAAADARMQCVIWVMKADGTSRGTLIATNTTALSNEFNTSNRNIKIPKGGSTVPTSVAALATDRIVVEIGYRKHESATTSRTVTFQGGNPSSTSDLPEDETTTTLAQGWVEFADTLSFSAAPVRASHVVTETAMIPASAVRASQVVTNAALVPSSAVRASQVVMQVALLGAVAAVAGQRVRVLWI